MEICIIIPQELEGVITESQINHMLRACKMYPFMEVYAPSVKEVKELVLRAVREENSRKRYVEEWIRICRELSK